jgi:beta-phosphoglucomutase-like phosphatase (HAD superfamily)
MPSSTPIAAFFDVEGTLVDCVALQLESWRVTLQEAGFSFTHLELSRSADRRLFRRSTPGSRLQYSVQTGQGRRNAMAKRIGPANPDGHLTLMGHPPASLRTSIAERLARGLGDADHRK